MLPIITAYENVVVFASLYIYTKGRQMAARGPHTALGQIVSCPMPVHNNTNTPTTSHVLLSYCILKIYIYNFDVAFQKY